MDETFTLLPLHLDPTSKALSSSTPNSDPTLDAALQSLNTLHRTLLSLPSETHATPPPPLPTNPKRSAQIQKMREQANTALRRNQADEAIKLYTYALEMSLSRPSHEPSALAREESALLYANRSQAYMVAQDWAPGLADAVASTECKRQGNGKAWWRRGRCLMEMGRVEEAAEVVREGAEVEGEGGEGRAELEALRRECESVGRKREERVR